MQIIKPFSELQWHSNALCDHIEKEAESLQKNNKKKSKIAYVDFYKYYYYSSERYTRDEIVYMVFHAIDNFNHKHCVKRDPFAHINLKIKGNYIIMINNDYKKSNNEFDKYYSKPTLSHINKLDEKKATVIFRADKTINELYENKYLISKSFDITDLIKNLENEEKYFLIISAILYIDIYDPNLRASVTDSKEDNTVYININKFKII